MPPEGIIAVTQPRRVAATSVAQRVSEEMDCRLGAKVGYQIRFDNTSSAETRIKYMTDGVLVREITQDPLLSRYGIIILDEAHERGLDTDILFGLLKRLLKKRPSLRLIVSSATLNTELFSNFFDKCPVIKVPGRHHPVAIFHQRSKSQNRSMILGSAVDIVLQIHHEEGPGHVLLFLTGRDEIERACELLRRHEDGGHPQGKDGQRMLILPLYGALPSREQKKVFEAVPEGTRKVIVSTNIAETSVTVDGIKYVVDPGFVKQRVYKAERGIDALMVVPISKAAAQQRAGRAGRTMPGKCYRLYPQEIFKEMDEETLPEIRRTNLSNTILQMKVIGINDVLGFDFLEAPLPEAVLFALKQLHQLSALSNTGDITALGRKMCGFPLDPCLAKMLIASEDLGCSDDIATIAAVLSSENIWFQPRKGKEMEDMQQRAMQKRQKLMHPMGDHLTYNLVYKEWERCGCHPGWCHQYLILGRALRLAQNIRKQLVEMLRKQNIPLKKARPGKHKKIRKAICQGFFLQSAQNCVSRTYHTLMLDEMKICQLHPSSSIANTTPPKCVVYHELVTTSKNFLRNVVAVEERWIKSCRKKVKRVNPHILSGRPIPKRKPIAKDSLQRIVLEAVPATVALEAAAAAASAKIASKANSEKAAAAKAAKAAALEETRRRYLARKQSKKM